LPYPPQQGTAIRNYNLMRQVAAEHEVHLLSLAEGAGQADPLGPLREMCASLDTVPVPSRSNLDRLQTTLTSPQPDMHHRLFSHPFHQKLQSALATVRPDVVQIEGLEMAQYGLPSGQSSGHRPPLLVFDDHNAEYLLQKRIFQSDSRRPRRWPGALYSLIQWQKLRRYESLACRRADRVVACSDADAEALRHLAPGLSPIVVPNGVDTALYRPDVVPPVPLSNPALVFTGKMDFRPNVDAVLWFATQVLPIIRQESPQVHLYIVGKNPHPRLAPLTQMPGLTMTGFVEDVRPYLAAASVCIVPLLTGGGTRLKVLEAMSMGKAIVSTTLGCEGIPATPGCDLILADATDDFARQVLALLNNGTRRQEIGGAARSFVERHFDWGIVVQPLKQAYEL
jgi:sugar transferase (PEP-CTERM/EpsH1 system associated)